MLALLDLLTGWTLFLSLALATGAVVMRWVVLPRAAPADDPSFDEGRASAARVGLRATGLLLIALVLVLARQLIEFHDPFGSWRGDARLTPLLGEASGQRCMRQAATIEFVVANIILLVTALLVRESPM